MASNIVEVEETEKEDKEEEKNNATVSSLLYTNTNHSMVSSSLSTIEIANGTEANVREKERQRSIERMEKIKEEARKDASYTTTNGIKRQQKLKMEKK